MNKHVLNTYCVLGTLLHASDAPSPQGLCTPPSQPLTSRNSVLMGTISAHLFLLHALCLLSFPFTFPWLCPFSFLPVFPFLILKLGLLPCLLCIPSRLGVKDWRLDGRCSHSNSPPILDTGIQELELSCHSRILWTSLARNSIHCYRLSQCQPRAVSLLSTAGGRGVAAQKEAQASLRSRVQGGDCRYMRPVVFMPGKPMGTGVELFEGD